MDQDQFFAHLLRASREGFNCAQILLSAALVSEERENPDLIRAIGGLNMGYGYHGGPCGALSGGCCLISWFAGKGEGEELEDPELLNMLGEYTDWFRQEFAARYGGESCDAILAGEEEHKRTRCLPLIQACYRKAMEILEENGVI